MRKFIFIILALFLISCDFKEVNQNLSELMSEDFISENIISAELIPTNSDTVELSIINHSNDDFYISGNALPINGMEKDVFTIYDGKEVLPFIGRLFYTDTSNIDWIRIEAGSDINSLIFLPASYKFPRQDTYEIFFDAPLAIKFLNNNIQIFHISSNIIKLQIENITTYDRAIVKPCSNTQINLLNKGKNISLNKVNNAIKYLSQKKADSYYKKWFGVYSIDRFNYVTNGFNKMVPAHKQSWTYSCETKENGGCTGYAAFVYKDKPYQVWVCMDYYQKTTDTTRGHIMIHEASHWNINFGTNDYVYGYNNGIELAKNNPYNATHCANNVEHYSFDIPTAGTTDPNPPTGTPKFTLNKTVFNKGDAIQIKSTGLDKTKKYEVAVWGGGKIIGKPRYITGKTSSFNQIRALQAGTFRVKLRNNNNILFKISIIIK
jgi:peptidyl-Lys metalloendopeptidase